MDEHQAFTDPLSMVQILGYIAAVLGIITFLQKNDTRMKIMMVVMTSVLCIHFILLERYTGAAGVILAGSRAGLSIFDKIRSKRHFICPIFILLSIALGMMTYQKWLDIFPFMAAINGSIAFFYLSGIKLRCAVILSTFFWLIHNLLALSYGPAAMELFILIANLTTIYRLHMDKTTEISRLK